jgi:hypothetical protein
MAAAMDLERPSRLVDLADQGSMPLAKFRRHGQSEMDSFVSRNANPSSSTNCTTGTDQIGKVPTIARRDGAACLYLER